VRHISDDNERCDEIAPMLRALDKEYDERITMRNVKYGDLTAFRKTNKVSIMGSAKAGLIILFISAFRKAFMKV
jgi:hypothetical protein